MADMSAFTVPGINPTAAVATGIRPAEGMKLSDIMSLASNAQSLQQAQQLNPLQLEKAQIELNQIRETSPLAIRQKQVETELAEKTLTPKIESQAALTKKQQFEAKRAGVDLNQHYANVARGVYGGHVTDPDFINGNKDAMIKKLDEDKEFLKRQGIPEHNSGMHDQLIELIKRDPKDAYQKIVTGLNIAAGPASQFGQVGPTQQSAIYQGQSAPVDQPVGQPVGQTAPVGQPAGVQPTQMNLPPESQPTALPYPVRVPGQPANLFPSENADLATGQTFRNGLLARQSNITTDRRNIDEVIEKAKELQANAISVGGGVGQAIERRINEALGTEQGILYKQLSKDLANAQIANIKAGGGSLDTVAGQQLQKMANGDVTYPPKILIDIAQRAKADLTNVDMQATAAQKFYQKYGDNNMKAFQQEWSKNADTKIFQIMNVANDPKMNRAEQQEETNKLLGITSSMSKDQQKAIRTQFNTKYQNIQKLYNDGTLR